MSNEQEKETKKVFKLNKETGEFKEIPLMEIPEEGIKKILAEDPASSYAIFQMEKYIVWLYHGKETSTKVKFMAARSIPVLRDELLIGGKIMTVDEGSEPLPFKFATKMADPEEYGVLDGTQEPVEFKPAYSGTEEDVNLLEKYSLEKVALFLEQIPTPNGYEREAVVAGNTIYAVKNVRRTYMGTEIEELELVPLPKDVEIDSGSYLAKNLNPRLIFENNRLILTEFLRKAEKRKQQEHFFSKLAAE